MPRIHGWAEADGLIVHVGISPAEADRVLRRSQGEEDVEASIATTALIDTGAMQTAIDPYLLGRLGFVSHGFARVATPGNPDVHVPVFDVLIEIVDGNQRGAFEARALGVSPATRTVGALIGRDILEKCSLLYDGPGGDFLLWF